MSRKTEDRIDDIIHSCEKILKYTSGMDQETLTESDLVTDAVLQNIEIIGEAAKHLPKDILAGMPSIE